ncbi:MAG: hypothetical protein HN952_02880 [Candidatus Cloacimonetes bacterium]|jgi:tetratricopeptide (TPR) repeat protein|nr:hypothetical protein [Candidatus Cloacimonadota bacterium]MBT6993879.1 hypothetical protein [Candidatus Cloacimonadota bacterium]MBT7469166.1 hypothetical protein [Candidatus Cloacimonadota bacterium]
MKNKLLVLILVIPIICSAYDFIDGGVRNSAMGRTGISSSNDASTAVWNPAFLGNLHKFELLTDSRKFTIQLDNDNWSQNVMYFAMPTKKAGTFVLNANYFGGDVAGESKFGFHFGKELPHNLFVGLSANYFSFDTEISSSSAYDCDFGIGYKLPFAKFGIVAKNLLQADLGTYSEDKFSRIYGFGSSLNLKNLVISADVQRGSNFSETEILAAIGTELAMKNLFIRAGMNNNYYTFGFGVDIFSQYWPAFFSAEINRMTYFDVSLDYAFQHPLNFEYTKGDFEIGNGLESEFGDHFFGLKINFGRTESKEDFIKFFPSEFGLDVNVQIDTVVIEKVKLDTIYREIVKMDTITIIEKVLDEELLKKKLAEAISNQTSGEIEVFNAASAHLIKSLEYYFAENFEKAIEECEKAIQIAPKLSLSYLRLGSIYWKLGDREEALYHWKKGYKVDSNNVELKQLLDGIKNGVEDLAPKF